MHNDDAKQILRLKPRDGVSRLTAVDPPLGPIQPDLGAAGGVETADADLFASPMLRRSRADVALKASKGRHNPLCPGQIGCVVIAGRHQRGMRQAFEPPGGSFKLRNLGIAGEIAGNDDQIQALGDDIGRGGLDRIQVFLTEMDVRQVRNPDGLHVRIRGGARTRTTRAL